MAQQISKTSVEREQKGLDLFGLISGFIGLVTNIITLYSFYRATESQGVSSGGLSSFKGLWIVSLISITYTVLIFSFYCRRVLIARYESRRRRRLAGVRRSSVENGISLYTCLFGTPLFVFYLYYGYQALREVILRMNQHQLERTFGTDEYAAILFRLGGFAIIVGPILSVCLCWWLNSLAETIYSALHRDYKYRVIR